jgi:hypothetical protein
VKRFANDDRSPAAQLRIERLYHPEPTALDVLVEVLQALLLDEPQSAGPRASSGLCPTCFPAEPE